MTIVLMESFDKYATGATGENGWSIGGNASISTATPRTGTRHFETRQDESFKGLPGSYSELIYGSGFRCNNIGAGNCLRFREIGVGIHVALDFDAAGKLVVKHANGTVLATGTTPVIPGVWYWLELRVKIHDTLGEVELMLSGQPEASATGVDTRNGGTGVINQLGVNAPIFNAGLLIDDIVIIDPTVGTPNDFIGDSRVECLFPNGNGNSSQFDGSDGNSTDNYLLVDEVQNDGDTTYVESNVVGEKDTYAYENTSLVTGTIYAVQISTMARKSSAGSRQYKNIARLSGGTEEDGSAIDLQDTYNRNQPFVDIRSTKPGGGAWTIADLNGAEFGFKVFS